MFDARNVGNWEAVHVQNCPNKHPLVWRCPRPRVSWRSKWQIELLFSKEGPEKEVPAIGHRSGQRMSPQPPRRVGRSGPSECISRDSAEGWRNVAEERAYRRADSETQEAINLVLVLLHKCDSGKSDVEDTPRVEGTLRTGTTRAPAGGKKGPLSSTPFALEERSAGSFLPQRRSMAICAWAVSNENCSPPPTHPTDF